MDKLPFKPGDIVRCIQAFHLNTDIEVGKLYQIKDVRPAMDSGLFIVHIEGSGFGHYSYKFELAYADTVGPDD